LDYRFWEGSNNLISLCFFLHTWQQGQAAFLTVDLIIAILQIRKQRLRQEASFIQDPTAYYPKKLHSNCTGSDCTPVSWVQGVLNKCSQSGVVLGGHVMCSHGTDLATHERGEKGTLTCSW
jgi:hypothetical protein